MMNLNCEYGLYLTEDYLINLQDEQEFNSSYIDYSSNVLSQNFNLENSPSLSIDSSRDIQHISLKELSSFLLNSFEEESKEKDKIIVNVSEQNIDKKALFFVEKENPTQSNKKLRGRKRNNSVRQDRFQQRRRGGRIDIKRAGRGR